MIPRYSAGDITVATRKGNINVDDQYMRVDHLIAAGVLVPVPDGEPCEIRNLESDFFIQGQTVYRVPSGEFYGLPLGYEGSHYAAFYGTHDTIVQPVRLVKLEDVG